MRIAASLSVIDAVPEVTYSNVTANVDTCSTTCRLAPPPKPMIKPSLQPLVFGDIPEFALPECACPETPIFEAAEEFNLPGGNLPECACSETRLAPPTPRLCPASAPMDLDDIPEFQLPDAIDNDEDFPNPLAQRSPGFMLAERRNSSMNMIFELDGLSDSSSDADIHELTLGELFGCDEKEESNGLLSGSTACSINDTPAQLEAIEELQEWSAPAPVKALEFNLQSPILAAFLRASSSCSTRESTPSPKADHGAVWRKEVLAALCD